jgi:hypothetical protein
MSRITRVWTHDRRLCRPKEHDRIPGIQRRGRVISSENSDSKDDILLTEELSVVYGSLPCTRVGCFVSLTDDCMSYVLQHEGNERRTMICCCA